MYQRRLNYYQIRPTLFDVTCLSLTGMDTKEIARRYHLYRRDVLRILALESRILNGRVRRIANPFDRHGFPKWMRGAR